MLPASWIQSWDREIAGRPLTPHKSHWSVSLVQQRPVHTHNSALCLSPAPTPYFSQDPHAVSSHPSSICPTSNPVIWVKDSGAVIFIEFPITLPRLQLSAGDLGLWLCCGSRCGASGTLRTVPGRGPRGSQQPEHRGKTQGNNNHHIYRWLTTHSLGPRPDLMSASGC